MTEEEFESMKEAIVRECVRAYETGVRNGLIIAATHDSQSSHFPLGPCKRRIEVFLAAVPVVRPKEDACEE